MFTKMNSAALWAALMLLAGSVNANAGLVPYLDFASWNAVVSNYTALAIPAPDPGRGDKPGTQYFGTGTASVSYQGVTFSTSASWSDGHFFNIGPEFSGSNGFFPVLSSQAQATGVANILITLAAPVNAFALNFDTFYGSDVSFTLSNGSDPVTLASAGYEYDLHSFFGVIDDKPFNTILLTSSDTALNINALKIGAAVSAIPEPATWVMLVLGFVGIGLFSSRWPTRRVSAR